MYFDKNILASDMAANEVGLCYFAHSCVFVRHRSRLLVFDFAVHASFDKDSFLGLCPLADVEDFDVYIFASHGHGDHWSASVLELPPRKGLYYGISFDITLPETSHDITVCRTNEWNEVGEAKVFSIPSSDEGVAYLVELPDLRLYFSGDNAFWDWQQERVAEGYFKDYLQPLIDLARPIDIAFQVADPRCHETHYGGIHDISTFLDIGLLVPIHNFNDFSHQEKMRDLVRAKHPKQKYWHVTSNGQSMRHSL